MPGCSSPESPSAPEDATTACDPTIMCCIPPPCRSATIRTPQGSLSASNSATAWLTTSCYHFDFQGVVSGSPGSYVLAVVGLIDPSPPYTYRWRLDAAAGTLTNATSATPTHSAPAAQGEGDLRLVGMDGATEAICRDQKRVKMYQDHLARDRANFGTGISCESPWSFTRFGTTVSMSNTWNCFGSVDHAYNGSGTGYVSSVNIPNGWTKTTYDAPISAGDWAAINSALRRGYVVSFWSGSAVGGYTAQHAHTCISGTTMYGANNEPVINATGTPATWRWFETTSQIYFNNVNAAPRTSGLLTRVVVHTKP